MTCLSYVTLGLGLPSMTRNVQPFVALSLRFGPLRIRPLPAAAIAVLYVLYHIALHNVSQYLHTYSAHGYLPLLPIVALLLPPIRRTLPSATLHDLDDLVH